GRVVGAGEVAEGGCVGVGEGQAVLAGGQAGGDGDGGRGEGRAVRVGKGQAVEDGEGDLFLRRDGPAEAADDGPVIDGVDGELAGDRRAVRHTVVDRDAEGPGPGGRGVRQVGVADALQRRPPLGQGGRGAGRGEGQHPGGGI